MISQGSYMQDLYSFHRVAVMLLRHMGWMLHCRRMTSIHLY